MLDAMIEMMKNAMMEMMKEQMMDGIMDIWINMQKDLNMNDNIIF